MKKEQSNNTDVRTKYTCKYCNKEYMSPVTECDGCGASEFIQVTYIVKESETKKTNFSKAIKFVLKIAGGFFAFLFIMGIIASIGNSIESEKYEELEYAYSDSLLTDETMFIGKKSASSDKDYYRTFKITGQYEDLDNIYDNIYSSQFRCFNFNLPCNVEIKEDNFNFNISELRFYYYGSSGAVDVIDDISNKIDKDMSLYLVDSNGNKTRLAIEKYSRDDYKDIADYFNSTVYTKSFSINQDIVQFEKILIIFGENEYEFDLDYSRASGYIEYYGLKDKT